MPWTKVHKSVDGRPDGEVDRHDNGARRYDRWALAYDALLGRAMFPRVVHSFWVLVNRYRIPCHVVADVGCGTGDFVRHLSKAGIVVFGIDRSAGMLAVARRKNRGNGSVLLRQDLRDLTLPVAAQLVTCNFDVLNYMLDESELERAFQAFHRNLEDRGHLIFDMVVAGPGMLKGGRRQLMLPTPLGFSVWVISVDPRRRIRKVDMVHFGGPGCPEREVHLQRAFSRAEVTRALVRSAFAPLGAHELIGARSPNGPRRLAFVARKVQ